MKTVTLSHPSRSNRINYSNSHTWNELLAYRTCFHFTVKLEAVKSKKNHQLFFHDLEIPPVLALRIQLTYHIVMCVYNPLHPQNSTWLQPVARGWYCFVIRDNERPDSSKKGSTRIPWVTPDSLCCQNPILAFPILLNLPYGSFLTHTLYHYLPWFLIWFNFVIKSITRSFVMLNILMENENTSIDLRKGILGKRSKY